MILDYTCKKAIGTDDDGEEIIYWYTEKIKSVNPDRKSAVAQLPGMALQYEIDREGMIMTFTASKVKTSLDEETKSAKFTRNILFHRNYGFMQHRTSKTCPGAYVSVCFPRQGDEGQHFTQRSLISTNSLNCIIPFCEIS